MSKLPLQLFHLVLSMVICLWYNMLCFCLKTLQKPCTQFQTSCPFYNCSIRRLRLLQCHVNCIVSLNIMVLTEFQQLWIRELCTVFCLEVLNFHARLNLFLCFSQSKLSKSFSLVLHEIYQDFIREVINESNENIEIHV